MLQSKQRQIDRERKQKEADAKAEIIMLRNQSFQIGEIIQLLFDKKKKDVTPLGVYYPDLFPETSKQKEMSLETYTDLFLDFAIRTNYMRRLQRGEELNGGDRHNPEAASSGPNGQFPAVGNGNEPGAISDGQSHGTNAERA
jgi:hypothetical protein